MHRGSLFAIAELLVLNSIRVLEIIRRDRGLWRIVKITCGRGYVTLRRVVLP